MYLQEIEELEEEIKNDPKLSSEHKDAFSRNY